MRSREGPLPEPLKRKNSGELFWPPQVLLLPKDTCFDSVLRHWLRPNASCKSTYSICLAFPLSLFFPPFFFWGDAKRDRTGLWLKCTILDRNESEAWGWAARTCFLESLSSQAWTPHLSPSSAHETAELGAAHGRLQRKLSVFLLPTAPWISRPGCVIPQTFRKLDHFVENSLWVSLDSWCETWGVSFS